MNGDLGRYAVRLVLALVLGLAGLLVVTSPGASDTGEGALAATERVQRLASLGTKHSCVVTGAGTVECWGDNEFGQLGTGDHATRTTPQVVSGLSGVLQVASGAGHSCALVHGGSVKCWGLNGSGQLGDGSEANRATPVDVAGLTGARRLVAGDFHTCALVDDGSVRCWGQDGMGQLGDGVPGDFSASPVEVQGLAGETVADLAAGEWHSCARTGGGKLLCWGHNAFGQLGDNTNVDKAVATPVVAPGDHTEPMSDVVAATAGAGHTCAVLGLPNRPTYCWGQNTYGQLGHETDAKPSPDIGMKDSWVPLQVQVDTELANENVQVEAPLANPLSVSAGQFHTCSVMPSQAVRCWGQNDHGQLGYDPKPSTGDRYESSRWAYEVPGASAEGVVSGGFHTCAVSGPGMECWGYDFHGQLGGHDDQVESPTTVTAVTGARHVAVATNAVCALLVDNLGSEDTTTSCWGDNDNGRLGSGSTTVPDRSTVRMPVVGTTHPAGGELGVATDLRAGNGSVCAVPQGSGRVCWGLGASGELGDGATGDRPVPTPSTHLAGATAYDLGGTRVGTERGTTCRVTGGEARCWGYNGQGQLGDGTTDDSTSPRTVLHDANGDEDGGETPLTGVMAVAVGGDHACAVVGGGQVRCWGANDRGQLGDGTVEPRQYAVLVQDDLDPDPAEVDPLEGVTALVAGDSHTCALLSDRTVRCWGDTGSGQLGRSGSGQQAHLPVTWQPPSGGPADLGNVRQLVSGDRHTCALRTDDSLVCWGENDENQLGAGSGDSNVGLVVLRAPDLDAGERAGLGGQSWIQDVSAGRNNTCAVLLDRTVSCWGDNTHGQVGDGIGVLSLAPVQVGGSGSVGENDIPRPLALTADTTPGAAVDIPVTLTGIDPDSGPNPVSLTSVADPDRGTASIVGPGTIHYVPDAGCQDDTFAYFVTDGLATVAGRVGVRMNCAPTPAADAASTHEDTSVDVDVLANDADPDGDTLTVDAIASQPAHGTATIVAGQVRYTPSPDYCSPPADTFTYRVSDGHGHLVEAPVTVTVSCGNDGPATGADVVATPEETELVVAVLANDGDVDGDPLVVQSVSTPAHGTTSTNGTMVRYVPAADYCGPDSFTYVVSDGKLTATGSVDVSVTCAGDSPRAVVDDVTTPEDTSVLVDVVANDTDPDPGDTLALAGTLGSPQHGTVALESGQVRYLPSADYCGPDSFTYVVEDGSGLTDTGRADVRVECAPDAPVAASDVATTDEDTTVHVHVLVNDTDVDGDRLHVAGLAEPANQPAHGTIAGAVGDAVAYTPAPNYCGIDSFGYDAVDPSGLVSSTTVSVVVECVDDPVRLAAVADQAVTWGEGLTVAIEASDPDAEPVDLSIVRGPTGGGAEIVGSTFTWTPTDTQVGTHDVTVRASSGGAVADRTFRAVVGKRSTTLHYDGSVSGQISDAVPVAAVLRDAVTGLPVAGRTVRFTLGAATTTAATEGSTGRATALLPVTAPVGARSLQSAFGGDAAYSSSSAAGTFAAEPETASVRLAGQPHVVTTGSSSAVTYVAELTEVPDGTYAGSLGGTPVTFRRSDGTTICTATASSTTAGAARASCSSTQPVGAQAVVVTATSPSYVVPADVGVVTVATGGAGVASGAGRASGDAFGFLARPVRKAAPQGTLVHVVRGGGTAVIVATSDLSGLITSCTKAKVCSARVAGRATSYVTVDLRTGAVTNTDADTDVVVDAVDPDRYAAQLSGAVTRTTGPSSPPPLIESGVVRVAG